MAHTASCTPQSIPSHGAIRPACAPVGRAPSSMTTIPKHVTATSEACRALGAQGCSGECRGGAVFPLFLGASPASVGLVPDRCSVPSCNRPSQGDAHGAAVRCDVRTTVALLRSDADVDRSVGQKIFPHCVQEEVVHAAFSKEEVKSRTHLRLVAANEDGPEPSGPAAANGKAATGSNREAA